MGRSCAYEKIKKIREKKIVKEMDECEKTELKEYMITID